MGIIYSVQAQQETPRISIDGTPSIKDPNLRIELVSEGLELPTSMAFLASNDILILEKDKGTVQRITDGLILPEPILDVDVANKSERGMLGIAVTDSKNEDTYVFLYYTESRNDGNDNCPKDNFCYPGNDPLGNRLYRYEFVNDKLTNPILILDLPATPGPAHNGGSVTIGPDDNVYVTIGDLRSLSNQNMSSLDGRGGILRVSQDGKMVRDGILSDSDPLNMYFAYGIRNSYGIDFDPLTGKLWDTENGVNYGDEINLVEPGFNSGWNIVQGIWSGKAKFPLSIYDIVPKPEDLLRFDRKSKFSLPELTWVHNIGPTSIEFLNSEKLGKDYENDIFIGDVHNGNLYRFQLNMKRTDLLLGNPISDRVVQTDRENEDIRFGEGFGSISDLEVGPDGYLYVVSIGKGKIFRIIPE